MVQRADSLWAWVRTVVMGGLFPQGRPASGKSLGILAGISLILSLLLFWQGTSSHWRGAAILGLVYLNAIFVLALVAVVGRRLLQVWMDRRRGLTGSQLHGRLVVYFGGISVVPAIVLTILAAMFFNLGLEAWFGDPIRDALGEARSVAQAYLAEHKKIVDIDARKMVADLRLEIGTLLRNSRALTDRLNKETEERGLVEAIIFDFDGSKKVVAKSSFTFAVELERLPIAAIDQAREGEVVLLPSERGDKVRALILLDPVSGLYLLIGKILDKAVMDHVTKTEDASIEYQQLDENRAHFQITIVLFFIAIAMLLLVVAIWIGLNLAGRLVQPITDLVLATDDVRKGKLDVTVPEETFSEEFTSLSRAFNQMTQQLKQQHQQLLEAKDQAEERHLFTENVLAGVSAAVLGLDASRRITLPNPQAERFFGMTRAQLEGKALDKISPALADLVTQAIAAGAAPFYSTITLEVQGKTYSVRACVRTEKSADGKRDVGFVLTFDDVSELQVAQRKAAWSDVARKIAHEIKNPLTPIQLSAERLRRRYHKQIDDSEIFDACIETIIRQVDHIGKMVTEFSRLAQMPTAVLTQQDLVDIVKHAAVLQVSAHSEVSFDIDLPDHPVMLACDAGQIGQAITNLMQNAIDALIGAEVAKPKVRLQVSEEESAIHIQVEDNGPGIPDEILDRVTEPYVTTKAKGSGIGLSVVAKIADDHGGQVFFKKSSLGGAKVEMVFPKNSAILQGIS